jgi:hypothetical protein
VQVDVSPKEGNGKSVWSNAIVVFDYESTTNYKFAGVFQILDRLIIGEVRNGKIVYHQRLKFPTAADTNTALNVSIDRANRLVVLTANGVTSISHTYESLGTGTVGVGTLNASARFDGLMIS